MIPVAKQKEENTNKTLQACGLDRELLRAALHSQGFMLLSGIFPNYLMHQLRSELDRARAIEEKRFGLEALQSIGQDGYVSDLFSIGPALETVLNHDVLHEAVSAALGDEARLYVGQGIILDPGKGRGVWPRGWHADMFEIRMALRDPTFCFGINCLVIVDDFTAENGPTCVLPGSHCLQELRVDQEKLDTTELPVIASSGSLLILDAGIWHSAGVNQSLHPRRVVKLLFTRRWISPQLDYSSITPEHIKARLSERVRSLVGLN